MEELVTLGALAVLLVGVHVAFAIHLYRSLSADRNREGCADGTETGSASGREPKSTASPKSDGSDADDGSGQPCPTCGTPNDPSFRFCRRCVSELSGQTAPKGNAINRTGG